MTRLARGVRAFCIYCEAFSEGTFSRSGFAADMLSKLSHMQGIGSLALRVFLHT